MRDIPSYFSEIWVVDFEFVSRPGNICRPICMVGKELVNGQERRLWLERPAPKEPPYPTGPESLFVAYYAPAELGCHLALGWPLPFNVIDLYVEFRNTSNGRATYQGNGLLGALAYYGLEKTGLAAKESMRELILSGGPWSDDEKLTIIDYCASDVLATERLWRKMNDGDRY